MFNFGGKGGFNPMSMFGGMMNGQGGNPMAMMQQMLGNNPQMMQMAQQIMSGNVSQDQMQGMLNQQMGGKAPNIQQIMDTLKRLQQNGEVIVVDDRALYTKFSGMGAGEILRYSPSVRGITIMKKEEFESKHM